MDGITKNVSVQGGNRLLKLSLKQGEYLNIGDNIRVVYAGGAGNHIWWTHREMSILPGIKQKQTRSAGKIPIMLSREFPEKHRRRLKRFYGMNA